MNSRNVIGQVSSRLQTSDSVLFITGAGLSADSGIPTYRSVGGLYDVDDTSEGLPIEELLSGEMLQSEPEVTWKYLAAESPIPSHVKVIARLKRHLLKSNVSQWSNGPKESSTP